MDGMICVREALCLYGPSVSLVHLSQQTDAVQHQNLHLGVTASYGQTNDGRRGSCTSNGGCVMWGVIFQLSFAAAAAPMLYGWHLLR